MFTKGEKIKNRVSGVVLGILGAASAESMEGAVLASQVSWGDSYIRETKDKIK